MLGGTFNPPHLGHVAAARYARRRLGLDLVVLMPAGTPPHKRGRPDPGAPHRLRMCRLAVAAEPGVEACGLETERPGPSYTVDTLRAIRASHPHAELTFIVGADTASTLPSWREPDALLELARLAVVGRAGWDRRSVLDAVAGVGERSRVSFLDMPEVAVSSSLVRRRAAAGEPLEPLVGDAVAGYIVEHGLYGAPVATSRQAPGAGGAS